MRRFERSTKASTKEINSINTQLKESSPVSYIKHNKSLKFPLLPNSVDYIAETPDTKQQTNVKEQSHDNPLETDLASMTKNPVITQHQNRCSPFVPKDTEVESMAKENEPPFIDVYYRSLKRKALQKSSDTTSDSKILDTEDHHKFQNHTKSNIADNNLNPNPNNIENKGPILILSDSMLRGIRPMRLSGDHYINKHSISGARIKEIRELVKAMNDTTRHKKVLIHVGTNDVLKDDHQSVISETKNLIDLIQTS